MHNKIREIGNELRVVFAGRGVGIIDSVVPLFIFLLATSLFPIEIAIWASLIAAGTIALFRFWRRQKRSYALGGLGLAITSALFYYFAENDSAIFVPGLLTGAALVVTLLISNLLSRPIAAYSSFLVRRWPIEWYWHPKVLPAYREVSWLWFFAFGARLAIEWNLISDNQLITLGTSRLLLGWPFTILVLVLSFLYGRWRLVILQGPSIIEFEEGLAPPWQGQRSGF